MVSTDVANGVCEYINLVGKKSDCSGSAISLNVGLIKPCNARCGRLHSRFIIRAAVIAISV
ncbi:hypothetical protein KB20921_12570 [Edwardsiella ictaluri]|nr:hypothetical protein KH20906_12280 [Edwardsiella ictaluri]BEI01996.1 hypothetical protein KB20921_12570 [Edwardsiella ictaluri]BEI05465.1 hypothetical protein KH201010_12510 [Edwardsiella ictaluri]BEI08925.1 hypothetical protein STU22726_12560 [Edwardsiella ictaluri]BEI12402.1 hypothetical protein STU22816_12550 [Edwardsiella ictaluri]